MIELLLPEPSNESPSLDALIARLSGAPARMPFDETAMGFVSELSRTILTTRLFRQFPELMAMAHWFRQANVRDLKSEFLDGRRVFVRRGVVFHIAPSNVDSVFVYSWLLSLLCGNGNIARLSRRRSGQMESFFDVTADLLARADFRGLADSTLVLSYEHDAAITAQLSAHCDLRVVWGGDRSVAAIRAIPLPALAGELGFANRFSLAVIDAATVAALDGDGISALAQRFANDAFWFNQQACSSPRSVVWIGMPDVVRLARDHFWTGLARHMTRMPRDDQPAELMDRVSTLFRVAQLHAGAHAETAPGAFPSRILVPDLSDADRACHGGNGLFIELERQELRDLIPILRSRDQTIAHFGFTHADWLALVRDLPPHAADRIVPIGEALSFATTWDGVDLLRAFTREVQIRVG
jgi:hypothetical protein